MDVSLTFFQMLIILSVFFTTIPGLSKDLNTNFHQNYILSIMENGDIQLISLKNKYESVTLDFSFPQNARFKFVYSDMEKFYFLHARKDDSLISMKNDDRSGIKYISKKEYFYIGGFFQYELQERFSYVQVGSYLWLFGK